MKRTFQIKYWEQYVPPRCRKPRSREIKEDVTIDIPELTFADAPVAIIQRSPFKRLWVNQNYGTRNVLPYHLFNGKLYVPCRRRNFECLYGKERNRWANVGDIYYSDYMAQGSKADAVKALKDSIKRFVLIDGKVCEEIGEPRYVVMTFGLGNNHGIGWGTALLTDNHYNPNIARRSYFRIDQEELARRYGRMVAVKRGDTKAIPQFDKRLYDRFEILIPEAVKLKVGRKAA